jgi:hypothetical protein
MSARQDRGVSETFPLNKQMNRTLTPLLLLFLIGAALTSGRATGQEVEPPVLVGVGKGQNQMEQLSHLYAINAKIVDIAAKIGTPVLCRAFVVATTHTNCCKPAEKVSTSCWYCCDSTVFCTDNAQYSSIVQKSTQVSDAEWKSKQTTGLDSIEGWRQIDQLLNISPPIEVSKDDPQFAAFQKRMAR